MTTEMQDKIIAPFGCPEPLCPGSMDIPEKQCYVDCILSTPVDEMKYGNMLIIVDRGAHAGCPRLQECITRNSANIAKARQIQEEVRAKIAKLVKEGTPKQKSKYGTRTDKGKPHGRKGR